MTKNLYQLVCLCAIVLGSLFIGSNVKSMAQNAPTYSFPGVSAFTTSSGRFGLFESGTGKIFLYDDNISECVFIGQLKTLGEPIEKLQ